MLLFLGYQGAGTCRASPLAALGHPLSDSGSGTRVTKATYQAGLGDLGSTEAWTRGPVAIKPLSFFYYLS